MQITENDLERARVVIFGCQSFTGADAESGPWYVSVKQIARAFAKQRKELQAKVAD